MNGFKNFSFKLMICITSINKTLGCFRLHSKQKSQNQNLEDKELLNIIKLDYGFKKKNIFFLKQFSL